MSGFGHDYPDVDVPPPWPWPDASEPTATAARSWQPVDPLAVLDGSYEPPQPTVGRRTDKVGLFYPGKVHTIASESEGGKTWLALAAARDELEGGSSVVYLDFEDDLGGIVGRLLALQTPAGVIRERFHYLQPLDPLGTGINRDDLTRLLIERRPTLAVLDGVTEAMVLHGLDPLDNRHVANFGRLLPRVLARHGAAVVALDHMVKNREAQGRYALGGAHKLNGLDGAAYVLDNRSPFGIGCVGRSTVKLAKDRPGQLRRHGLPSAGGMVWFADLTVTSHAPGFVEVELLPPEQRPDTYRPTVLMGRVVEALTRAPDPLTMNGITDRVTGKTSDIRRAVAALIDDGQVTTEQGPRNATLHRLVESTEQEGSP